MDLLETILRASNAEKYLQNFRKNGLDAFSLRILTEEDLKIIEIREEEVRKSILKHVENMQIPSEKNLDIIVDKLYIQLVLSQVSLQMTKNLANLSCGLIRKDVDLCDIKLSPAAKCLEGCLVTMEKQLNALESTLVTIKKKGRKRKRNFLVPTLIATVAALFICRKFLLFPK